MRGWRCRLSLVGAAVAVAGAAAVAIVALGDGEASKNSKEMESREWRKRKYEFHKLRQGFDLSGKGKPDFEGQTHDSPRLEVTNEAGETLLAVAKVPDPGPVKWEDATGAKGKRTQISGLNQLLLAVADLGIAGEVLSSNYMEVVVPAGEKLADAAAGGGALRGFFKDAKGQIKGHAELFRPDLLTGMVCVGALWNIAAAVLAQKHLHDIGKELDRMSGLLEEIGQFQKIQRFANLRGTLREFIRMKREMADDNFDHISTDTVESECIQLSKIEAHISQDVSRAIEGLENANGLGAEFDQGIERVVKLLKELGLCVMAKLYGCQIMAIVSEDPAWLKIRLDEVQDDIERLAGHYDATVDAVLGTLDKGKDSPDSLELLSRLRSSDEMESIVTSVDKEMAATWELVRSRNAPVSVLLKINGGEISGFAVAETCSGSGSPKAVERPMPGCLAGDHADLDQPPLEMGGRPEDANCQLAGGR